MRLVKISMNWSKLIFLSHPAYSAAKSREVLETAQSNAELYSQLLDEFASFCLSMIEKRLIIVIELTIASTHTGNAFALAGLGARGLHVLSEHASHFLMQGGRTGASAFPATTLANYVRECRQV